MTERERMQILYAINSALALLRDGAHTDWVYRQATVKQLCDARAAVEGEL